MNNDSIAIPAEHPMDLIPVRALDFDMAELGESGAVWSRSSPEFAIFINALGLHVPYFERYLVRSMVRARPMITDHKLRADLDAIVGQEAHHARNFIAFNRYLAGRYPRAGAQIEHAKDYFLARSKHDDLRLQVGFTAGYETFTFLAGMIILENYDRWLKDADPMMKAMWIWHQVEEVEHGAVAFEVYQALHGADEWFRKWMILKALTHIVAETLPAYFHMCKVEGRMRTPASVLKSSWFAFSTLGRMAWHALPTFSKSYHPRRHPLATTKQNPIATAWRRYAAADGDVLRLDGAGMNRLMAQQ